MPYGVSEMYVTPRNFGSEVFFYIKCDKAAITFSWLTPLRGITKIVSSPAMVASISLGAWESMSEAIPMA